MKSKNPQIIKFFESLLRVDFDTAINGLVGMGAINSREKIIQRIKNLDLKNIENKYIHEYALASLGFLGRAANKTHFKKVDELLLKPIKRTNYDVGLKISHRFPDGNYYTSASDSIYKGRRVLVIKQNGEEKCVLGFAGTTIDFVQGIAGEKIDSGVFENAVSEYLKLMKPLIQNGEIIRFNGWHGHRPGSKRAQMIRDRFFTRKGELSLSKRRTKEALL